MQHSLLSLILLALSGSASVAPDFQIPELEISQPIKDELGEETVDMTGVCGAGSIDYSGVSVLRGNDGSMHYEASVKATLTVYSKVDTITSQGNDAPIFVDGKNKLACIETPTNTYLLVAAFCPSANCDPVNYTVIVPDISKVISGEACDKDCAQKLIGQKVPENMLNM